MVKISKRSMVVGLALGAAFWVGCSEDSGSSGTKPATPPPPTPTPVVEVEEVEVVEVVETRTPEELVEAGRVAYNANCIACHSADPAQDGALGPAVAGASYELLEARVLRAEYPAGYTPKRDTRVMVALPHLEPRLVELAAFLAP